MSKHLFRPGDIVKFQFVNRTIQGVVKEDRGPIGVKGRRLYGIEFRLVSDADELSYIELPAEQIQLVPDAVSME